jgi:hypothetical protein
MDNTLTSILAALGGSVIGASTPVLSNFVLQRSQTQRELDQSGNSSARRPVLGVLATRINPEVHPL